jgi:hypothetical protein
MLHHGFAGNSRAGLPVLLFSLARPVAPGALFRQLLWRGGLWRLDIVAQDQSPGIEQQLHLWRPLDLSW